MQCALQNIATTIKVLHTVLCLIVGSMLRMICKSLLQLWEATGLPKLAQVISLVGWPKLAKSFFFFFFWHSNCGQRVLTAFHDMLQLIMQTITSSFGTPQLTGIAHHHSTAVGMLHAKGRRCTTNLAWEVLEPEPLSLVVAVHIDEVGCVHHHPQPSLVLNHKSLAVIGAKLDG